MAAGTYTGVVADEAPSGLALALEMNEAGILMREQRYRRDHPEATDEEVELFVRDWILDRPGAPHGDSCGRSVPFPRRP